MATNPKRTAKQIQRDAEREAEARNELIRLEAMEIDTLTNKSKLQKDALRIQAEILQQENLYNQLVKERNKEESRHGTLQHQKSKSLGERLKIEKEKLVTLKKQRNVLLEQEKSQKRAIALATTFGTAILGYLNYLMDADKAFKDIALTMGVSGEAADNIRNSLSGAAIHSASLGMSVSQTAAVYKNYTEMVGRNLSITIDQVKAMNNLAKGTSLGADGAAEMGAHFESFGIELVKTSNIVSGIMDSTERMGINAHKVLTAVNKNFKSLQTYGFRRGIQGMGDLASHAEKFKVDISSAVKSAEDLRKLDNVIEAGAKLQVLGGQFASLGDTMAMFHESRNDLTAFNKRISDMTKGMVTLTKTANGFEFDIASPQARDMLEHAGKALGFSTEQMTEMARQSAKVSKIQQEMFGGNFNRDQRQLIEGMAQLNNDTGEFFVNIGDRKIAIKNLTKDQVNLLKVEKKTLEQRAKAAQTFDQQFGILLNELKATFLPMLEGVNAVFTGVVRPTMDVLKGIFENFNENFKGYMKIFGGLLAISPVILGLMGVMGKLPLIGGIMKGVGGALSGMGGKTGSFFSKILDGGGTKMGSSMGSMGTGFASAGKAAMGFGVGIGAAAGGIGLLASQLKDLNMEQLQTLQYVSLGLGGAFVGMTIALGLLAPKIAVAGTALIPFGAAITLIGAGIGIAAGGIGYMAKGFGELVDKSKGSADSLYQVAGGITAINAAMMGGGLSSILGGGIGFAQFAGTIGMMASNAERLAIVGDTFKNIAAVMNGDTSQFDKIANSINKIASVDIGNSASIAELSSLLKQGIEVRFGDKAMLNADITLNIDKDVLMKKSNMATEIVVTTSRMQKGKQAS